MATVAERNAAFDKVHKDLLQLIVRDVPGLFQNEALERLDSPQGREALLQIVTDALVAAEKVRNS